MPGKGKPKPVLPLQNKKRQEKTKILVTKKSKRRKTNYKPFFDFPFHPGPSRSILNELNRIQNSLQKKNDFIINEKQSYTERFSSLDKKHYISNKSLVSLRENMFCYISDEVVGVALAMLRDHMHTSNKHAIVASGLFFIPKLLHIRPDSSSDNPQSFQYGLQDDLQFIRRLPRHIGTLLGLGNVPTNIFDHLLSNEHIEMLLIPVNIINYHWILLEINFKERHITIHDSSHYDTLALGLDKNVNVVYNPKISNKIFNAHKNKV